MTNEKFTVHIGGGETSEIRNVPLKLLEGGKGMIQLSNTIFKDEYFKSGFMKLSQSEINPKAFYTIKRVSDKINQQARVVDPEDKRIRDTYVVKKTVKGEVFPDGTNAPDTEAYEWSDKEKANLEFKTLYEGTFNIEAAKIPLVDVEYIKLTAAEWDALSPIIDGL